MTFACKWKQIRLWLFKESKSIDEETRDFSQKLEDLKQASARLNESIEKVSQPDALRSLVISMNRSGRGH